MTDDLLTTVKKALALDTGCLCGLPQCAECRAWSPLVENRNILRALLARCEAAEGCDGNCSCVVMSRHEWQRAYSEERLKREAAEAEVERLNSPVLKSDWQQMVAERDAARAEAARLKKELAAKIPGQVVQSIRDDRDRLRAEAARLRGLVDEVRACGTEDDDPRLRYMIVQIDKGLWGDLKAALDTPAREGGET
jgi:outer membrane murein-binding lipoprotein Lpp